MKRFPILLNYDPTRVIGWLEISADGIAEDVLLNCAIVPGAKKGSGDRAFSVENFGLIPRSTVDTRERDPETGVPN